MIDQKQYMLLFSIGPVQSFITQARKTRDLMLGSFLLSMMMEAAMHGLKDQLVFPADPTIHEGISNLPNKFVALFDDRDAAIQAATDSGGRIEERWDIIRNEVWEKVFKPTLSTEEEQITREIWDRQSDPGHFFEIFWVVVEGDLAHYTEWLSNAQEAFEARKRFRNFEQQKEQGEKSTVSGERVALRGKGQSREEVKAFWERVTHKELPSVDAELISEEKRLSSKDISLDGSERLDAIDTIKRFALFSPTVRGKLLNPAFPSTSLVAAAPLIDSLLTEPLDDAVLQRWRNATRGKLVMLDYTVRAIPYLKQIADSKQAGEYIWLLRRDGDLYFPETFTPKRLEEDYDFARNLAPTEATRGHHALNKLLEATDMLNIPRPTRYYAFIEMDGDHMGEILKTVASKEEHKAVSAALSDFSEYVPELVQQQYPGRLVYSGGDDVVVLAPLARNYKSDEQEELPIKTIFDLAYHLQHQYCERVRTGLLSAKSKKEVSASIGIAIAHHLTSLSYVRRSAKAAEKCAKEQYGRDALVVTVIRRSGEQTRVGCHWSYPGLAEKGQPIPLARRFYELFKEDLLSPKSVFILLEEAPALVKLEQEAQQSEIRRVLLRQSRTGLQKEARRQEIEQLAEYVAALASAMDKDERHKHDTTRVVELQSEKRRYGLVEVLGWLLVSAFLAQKEPE